MASVKLTNLSDVVKLALENAFEREGVLILWAPGKGKD
jgi:hypothetical protein